MSQQDAGAQASTDAAGTAAAAAAGTPPADAAAQAAAAAATAAAGAADTGAAAAAAGAAAATGAESTDTGQADAAAAAAAAAAAGAPEKYELTVPEGGSLDQEDLDAFAELARAKNLTNEQAQAAVTEHATALKAQSDRFLTETQTHTEIGGAHFAAAQQQTQAVLNRFLPPDSPEGKALRAGMDKTGYGNWAPFVLLFSRIGKAMGEDGPAQRQAASGQRRSAADVLFGDAKQ